MILYRIRVIATGWREYETPDSMSTGPLPYREFSVTYGGRMLVFDTFAEADEVGVALRDHWRWKQPIESQVRFIYMIDEFDPELDPIITDMVSILGTGDTARPLTVGTISGGDEF